MSKYEPETTLQAPIFLENDFEEDDDGISYVISSVFIGDEEDSQKKKIILLGMKFHLLQIQKIYGDILAD